MDDSRYPIWQRDAEVLAEIGQYLFMQNLSVQVSLPAALAARALAAWQRDESDASLPLDETQAQQVARVRAGTVALIGLSIENAGSSDGTDDVVVDLDSWYVGSALDAADEGGRLDGLFPPQANP